MRDLQICHVHRSLSKLWCLHMAALLRAMLWIIIACSFFVLPGRHQPSGTLRRWLITGSSVRRALTRFWRPPLTQLSGQRMKISSRARSAKGLLQQKHWRDTQTYVRKWVRLNSKKKPSQIKVHLHWDKQNIGLFYARENPLTVKVWRYYMRPSFQVSATKRKVFDIAKTRTKDLEYVPSTSNIPVPRKKSSNKPEDDFQTCPHCSRKFGHKVSQFWHLNKILNSLKFVILKIFYF